MGGPARIDDARPFDTYRSACKIKDCSFCTASHNGRHAEKSLAEVAELADAHGSGPCTRKGVGVRVPSSAPSVGPSLSSGFRLRAPAPLTPANRLKFESLLRHQVMLVAPASCRHLVWREAAVEGPPKKPARRRRYLHFFASTLQNLDLASA